jgi:hypothetical protein
MTAIRPLQVLTGQVSKQKFIGGGGYADVYEGKWETDSLISREYPEIVIKIFRAGYASGEASKLSKAFKVGQRICG